MATTDIRRTPVAAWQAGPRPHACALVAAVTGAVTLLIRLVLHGRSFDLFGDEVLYTDLGRSVVSGGFPRFGGPFFLHGPGFFYLEAGWARLRGHPLGVMAQVDQMRTLNALLAAATAVALVPLAARSGSLRAGAAAGLLFALDPFCIRQNDRVLLETAMMLWVTLGYLVFTSLVGRRPARREWPRAVGAGLLFGVAVLTKDVAVLVTLLPLLAAVALGWGPRRGLTLLTAGTTVAVYAVYVAVVSANGYFGVLWPAKTAGIERMLGLTQTTGFHSSGGGSLTARLIGEGASFGTTYAVLALAVPALVVVVLRRGGPQPRMLALLYCAAAVALAYALLQGTLEEQELYLLIIPSVLIVPVAVTLVRETAPRRGRSAAGRRAAGTWTAVITTALVLALGLNLVTFVQWLRQPDDGFTRLIHYVTAHVPAGTRVGTIEGDIETPYALGDRYDVGLWETPAALSGNGVRYVVVEWSPVNEGYSDQTPSQVRRLVGNGRVVFSFDGRTYGDLGLYQMSADRQARPAAGQ